MAGKFDLERRSGPKPATTQPKRGEPPLPHSQISQNAPHESREALFELQALPGVSVVWLGRTLSNLEFCK